MLEIKVPISPEYWDEEKEEFIEPKYATLRLEHSLVSISKWEAKWKKPFIVSSEKSLEETIDYVKCMTITQNVDPDVYNHLTNKNVKDILDYIDDPMTATTFSNIQQNNKHNGEQTTSELIYYWMIELGIPFECQKWHFNRLITLIKIFNAKNSKNKKMSKMDTASRYSALNKARRKKYNSRG